MPSDPLDALDALSSLTKTEIPYPLRGIADRRVNFSTVIASNDMADEVLNYLAK